MAAVAAGNKRPRLEDWQDCDDVPALRQMLVKQAEDLKKLKTENSRSCLQLRKAKRSLQNLLRTSRR